MIKKIYILNSNGRLIYSKNFIQQEQDDNLLIGFFTSIVNFSREALESIIKFVDLGEGNKLILETKPEEEIFGAAIVSSRDNTALASKILNNILEDFLDDFSPDYNITAKNVNRVDIIIEINLKRKIAPSLKIRLIETWLILIPLGILLTYFNIMATEYFASSLYFRFFSMDEILISIIPQVVLISLAELILVFGIANLIAGYFSLNLKLCAINSSLYFIYILTAYFIYVKPVLALIIITFFPFIIVASLVAFYVGHMLALQRKMLK